MDRQFENVRLSRMRWSDASRGSLLWSLSVLRGASSECLWTFIPDNDFAFRQNFSHVFTLHVRRFRIVNFVVFEMCVENSFHWCPWTATRADDRDSFSLSFAFEPIVVRFIPPNGSYTQKRVIYYNNWYFDTRYSDGISRDHCVAVNVRRRPWH